MTWLVNRPPSQAALAQQFWARVQTGPALVLPGAHEPLAGLIARDTGFEALYLSGAAYTASRGLPDVGLISATEVASRARDIVRATGLPLVVDIDTGFGGPLSAARAAREMVEAGAVAVQIEDQVMPKRCGHLAGKSLVSPEEMAQKVRAMKQVAPDLFVIARTDARAVEDFSRAIDRLAAYCEAGADILFPEALTSAAEFRTAAQELHAPLLANMTEFGVTPQTSVRTFESWGYRIVIYPVSALRLALRAYVRTYQTLLREGSVAPLVDEMYTRSELYSTLQYHKYEALDETLVVPLTRSPSRKPEQSDPS